MSCHNQADQSDSRIDNHRRAIEEAPACPTFRMGRLGICWLFEASGNSRQIEQTILFAPDNDSQSAEQHR